MPAALQAESFPRFCILFGGFFDKERVKANKLAMDVYRDDRSLPFPSLHVVGERDAYKKVTD